MLARILIVLAVVCGSLLPVWSRILGECGWDALQVQGGRAVVAAVVLGIALRGKILEAKARPKSIMAIALTMTIGGPCYILAATRASLGLVIAVVYLGPVWVVLYEWIFRKVRSPLHAAACAIGFVGTVLLASQMDWSARTEITGILCALVASLSYGAFLAISNRMGASVNSFVVSFWAYALGALVFAVPMTHAPWSLPSAGWVLLLGLTNGVLYLTLIHAAMSRFPTSSEGSVWTYLEVVIVWMIGIFVYDEAVRPVAILGTILIVLAGLLTLRTKNGSATPPEA